MPLSFVTTAEIKSYKLIDYSPDPSSLDGKVILEPHTIDSLRSRLAPAHLDIGRYFGIKRVRLRTANKKHYIKYMYVAGVPTWKDGIKVPGAFTYDLGDGSSVPWHGTYATEFDDAVAWTIFYSNPPGVPPWPSSPTSLGLAQSCSGSAPDPSESTVDLRICQNNDDYRDAWTAWTQTVPLPADVVSGNQEVVLEANEFYLLNLAFKSVLADINKDFTLADAGARTNKVYVKADKGKFVYQEDEENFWQITHVSSAGVATFKYVQQLGAGVLVNRPILLFKDHPDGYVLGKATFYSSYLEPRLTEFSEPGRPNRPTQDEKFQVGRAFIRHRPDLPDEMKDYGVVKNQNGLFYHQSEEARWGLWVEIQSDAKWPWLSQTFSEFYQMGGRQLGEFLISVWSPRHIADQHDVHWNYTPAQWFTENIEHMFRPSVGGTNSAPKINSDPEKTLGWRIADGFSWSEFAYPFPTTPPLVPLDYVTHTFEYKHFFPVEAGGEVTAGDRPHGADIVYATSSDWTRYEEQVIPVVFYRFGPQYLDLVAIGLRFETDS